MIKQFKNSELPEAEKENLVDKMGYCNFMCIPFKKKEKGYFPDFDEV